MGNVLGRGNSTCKVAMGGGKHWRNRRKATPTRTQGTVWNVRLED